MISECYSVDAFPNLLFKSVMWTYSIYDFILMYVSLMLTSGILRVDFIKIFFSEATIFL
jgi:hypothetical protein